MKPVILYSLFIIATAQFAVSVKISTNYRVLRGTKAKLGQFPFVVKLRPIHVDRVHCGAAIISPTILLTVAHCFCLRYSHEHLYAEVGIVDTYKGKGKLYKFKSSVCHPKWKYIPEINKSTDDIGIGRIDGEITFTPYVKPIQISHEDVPTGEMITAMGYGCTSFTDTSGSDFLMYARVKKLSHKACQEMYEYADKYLLCTYTPGKQMCFGDSGSPMIYKGKVVALSMNGNETDNPDLDIRVKAYIPWIEKTIKELA